MSNHCSRDEVVETLLQRRPGLRADCQHGIHKRCQYVAGALRMMIPMRCHLCSSESQNDGENSGPQFGLRSMDADFSESESEGAPSAADVLGTGAFEQGHYGPDFEPPPRGGSNGTGTNVGARAGFSDRYEEQLRRAGLPVHEFLNDANAGPESSAEQNESPGPCVEDHNIHPLLALTFRRLRKSAMLALGRCVFRIEIDENTPLDRRQTRFISVEKLRKGDVIYQDLALIEVRVE